MTIGKIAGSRAYPDTALARSLWDSLTRELIDHAASTLTNLLTDSRTHSSITKVHASVRSRLGHSLTFKDRRANHRSLLPHSRGRRFTHSRDRMNSRSRTHSMAHERTKEGTHEQANELSANSRCAKQRKPAASSLSFKARKRSEVCC